MKLFCSSCQKVFEAEKSPDSPQVKCPKCGTAQDYPAVIPGPGVVLGDFLIEKLLSRGGMGEVFLAKQISLDRPVALKVLQQKHLEDKEYVESLFKEARAAAKLSHPNIVQAYAVGEDNGIFYFAMEYIRGETFKQILKREKSIEFTRAATVVRDIARALGAAWKEQKLVHQDIKPDNIMLDANGFAKLADLGLAKVATGGPEDAAAEEGDEVLGTPQYISPEQLTGVPTDIRSDIYSLGATFYHFVTGRFPYVADTGDEIARMHIECALQPPKEVNPALPDALNRIIIKMMEKDINRRYQSAEALVDDLDAYLRSAPPASASAKKAATASAKPAVAKAAPVKKAAPPKLAVPGKGGAAGPAKVPVLKKPSGAAASVVPAPSVPKVPSVTPPAATPPAAKNPPPETLPAGGDKYEGLDEPSRFRRPLKIALSVLAGMVLLAVIVGAALVICYKYQVLPEALVPAGRTVSQWIDFSAAAQRPKTVKPRPAAPAAPVVRTRPEFIAGAEKVIKMPTGTPDQQDKFLAAADAFFAVNPLPLTAEEWRAYRRLRAVFAPVDEDRRFVPFRARARETRLSALAEVERVRAREQAERELRERQEREAQERRRLEDSRREAELRRIQAERRRQAQERAARVKQDVRAASARLISGFYAALNGDPQAFSAAREAADMVVLPAGELTPEEKRVIDGFRALRSQLPGELDKLCAFRDSVTNMKDGFWCSLPGAGGLCQIVTLAADGSVTLRRNGKLMRLPDLGRDRRSFDKALAAYQKGKHALFYYGLMTRRFDAAMKKDAPAGFWKRYIDVFGKAAGAL